MLGVHLRDGRIEVGNRFSLRLERTLRVPDDGKAYPLPPTFGAFPVYVAESYRATLGPGAAVRGAFIVPLYQFEALWLSFEAAAWKPNAVQIGSGGVNALTGESFPGKLKAKAQNYLVCPDQPWLDGFKTARNAVRQFVAVPLGKRLTVHEQLIGSREVNGLLVRVYEPRPGVFPSRRPRNFDSLALVQESVPGAQLGLGAGGVIAQKVYPDAYGLRVWDPKNYADVEILIVNSRVFQQITGKPAPPSPISAAEYSRLGLPWYELYDHDQTDIAVSARLRRVKSLSLRDEPATPGIVKGMRMRKGGTARRRTRG